MSRIGRLPIPMPKGVKVEITDDRIKVSGPRGELQQALLKEVEVTVDQENGRVLVARKGEERHQRSAHGLVRSLINNMVVGVTQGFTRTLDIVGVGYRAALKDGGLQLLLGYSHPRFVPPIDGISFQVEGNTRIVITGNDRQQVGQVAADIRAMRPPEPYKGKGIRYTNEKVQRKVGKAGKI